MEDVFAGTIMGRVALEKLKPVDPDFMFYYAGWLGENEYKVLKLSGAEFREARSGPRKGQVCILVKGTQRSVYLTAEEMRAAKESECGQVGSP